MTFVKVNFKQAVTWSPAEITTFIKTHCRELKCEDRYRLEKIRETLLMANGEFIHKFFDCEIMRLAYRQTCQEYPNMEYMTQQDKREHPEVFNRFVDRLFKNAHKILLYKIEQTKQQKRRAKRTHLTK
jgi:hypothetical protein